MGTTSAEDLLEDATAALRSASQDDESDSLSPVREQVVRGGHAGRGARRSSKASKRSRSGSSSSSLRVGTCPRCDRQCLSNTDPHTVCINCLGPNHGVRDCDLCQAMPHRRLVERSRRLIWWSNQGLDKCPSSKAMRNLCSKGRDPPACLETQYVTSWFTPRPPTPVPKKK